MVDDYRRTFVEPRSLAIVELVVSEGVLTLEWSGRYAFDDDGSPHDLPDRSVWELGLPQSALQALSATDVRTLSHLLTQTADGLLEVKGFGPKSLEQVRSMLRELGLHLALDPPGGERPAVAVIPAPFFPAGGRLEFGRPLVIDGDSLSVVASVTRSPIRGRVRSRIEPIPGWPRSPRSGAETPKSPRSGAKLTQEDWDLFLAFVEGLDGSTIGGASPARPGEHRSAEDDAEPSSRPFPRSPMIESLDADRKGDPGMIDDTGQSVPRGQSVGGPGRRPEEDVPSGYRAPRSRIAPSSRQSHGSRGLRRSGAQRTLPAGTAVLEVRGDRVWLALVPMKADRLDLADEARSIHQALGAGRNPVDVSRMMDELGGGFGSSCRVGLFDLDGHALLELGAERQSLRLREMNWSTILELDGAEVDQAIGISDELGGCLVIDDGQQRVRLYPSNIHLQTDDGDLRVELLSILVERIRRSLIGWDSLWLPHEGVTVHWRGHGASDREQQVQFQYLGEAGEWIDRNGADAEELWVQWGSRRRILIHRPRADRQSTHLSQQSGLNEPVTVYWYHFRGRGRERVLKFPNMAVAGDWIEYNRVGRDTIWLQWGTGRRCLIFWSAIDGSWAGETA